MLLKNEKGKVVTEKKYKFKMCEYMLVPTGFFFIMTLPKLVKIEVF